jgi:hypothetical protein
VDKTVEGDDEPGHPETQIKLASKFAWFGSDDCKSLMTRVTHTQGGNLFAIQAPAGIKKEFPPCASVETADDVHAYPTGRERSAGKEKLRL